MGFCFCRLWPLGRVRFAAFLALRLFEQGCNALNTGFADIGTSLAKTFGNDTLVNR